MMKRPYPELQRNDRRAWRKSSRRKRQISSRTIDAGLDRIERLFANDEDARAASLVRGSEAADLYTTHGFPPELFETLAAEHNLAFDWEGFQHARWKSTA